MPKPLFAAMARSQFKEMNIPNFIRGNGDYLVFLGASSLEDSSRLLRLAGTKFYGWMTPIQESLSDTDPTLRSCYGACIAEHVAENYHFDGIRDFFPGATLWRVRSLKELKEDYPKLVANNSKLLTPELKRLEKLTL